MGKVAGVPSRLFGLRFAMSEERVDLFRQRTDFGREVLPDPGLLARANRGNLPPYAPQRPQSVEGLKRGEDEQSDAERREAPEQDGAQVMNLIVEAFARLRDLEPPARRGPGQDRVALGDAQRL